MSRPDKNPIEEPPPIFKTWRAWYLTVILNLGAMVGLFYLISRIYR